MELGTFSVSLAVKDLQASKDFYQQLGFEIFGGDESQNWLIMRNGDTTIGLFQGMFEKNILTFNPGWDKNATEIDQFTDVRKIQSELKAKGIEFLKEANEEGDGPESCVFNDPDGNMIMLDQHV